LNFSIEFFCKKLQADLGVP